MSVSVTPTIKTTITGTLRNTAECGAVASVPLTSEFLLAMTNGTANGQCDLVFFDEETLTTGANKTYDLTALTDQAFGQTLDYVKVRAIIIYSTLAANKQLTIGAGSNPLASFFGDASDAIKLDPLGLLVLTNPNTGYAVTADTGDILKILNASGGSSTFQIWIFGTSA